MITRLALKSSLFGSVGSAAWLSTAIDMPENDNNKPIRAEITNKQKRDYSTQQISTVTLEVVEMYEKNTGCRFVYAENFDENKSYSARGWFNRRMKSDSKNEKKWRDLFADGLVFQKSKCGKGEMLVLEINKDTKSFKTKIKFKFQG